MPLFFLLLPLISVTFISCVQSSHTPSMMPNQFELNPAKIDLLLRRTALMALLRAKANIIMGNVPLVERVLFKQCVAESTPISPMRLAKCLTKLIHSSRDQLRSLKNEEATPAAEEQIRQEGGPLLNKKRTLRRIRHFFAVWRRREGQRREKEMMAMMKKKKRQKRAMRRTGAMGGMKRTQEATKFERSKSSSMLLSDSIRNLRELERYMQIFDKARRSISRINAHNTELVSRFDPFVNVRPAMPDGPLALLGLQQQITRFFDSLGTDQKIAVLSPRFFSLFPSPQRRRIPHVLSPDLFSFYNTNNNNHSDSSLLSIPNILNSALLGERESAAWLELLLNITGSAKIMEHLVVKLKPDVQLLERDILPIIAQMDQAEQRWQRLHGSLSEKQRQMVESRGYTPLAEQQRKILFPDMGQQAGCSESGKCKDCSESGKCKDCSESGKCKDCSESGKCKDCFESGKCKDCSESGKCKDCSESGKCKDCSESEFECSEETAEREFEQNIAELARMEEGDPAVEHKLDMFIQDGAKHCASFRQERRRRKKRQDEGGLAPDTEEGVHQIPRTVALEPFAFDTRLGGVVLEGIYLSPTAFYRELASPEVLTIRALSPIAFYASILSPMVAFARVLSPEVFKAQILTPQILDAFVLSPEAFMAEVLSPLVAEGRVLAPRTMFVQILGPTAGALHIGSSDTYGILVLSPHILSPRIYSEERYLIEILSPHFLGGEHERTTEEDTHSHLGGTVRFVGWPGHSPLGELLEKHEEHKQMAVERT